MCDRSRILAAAFVIAAVVAAVVLGPRAERTSPRPPPAPAPRPAGEPPAAPAAEPRAIDDEPAPPAESPPTASATEPWRDPTLPAETRAAALLDLAEQALAEQRLVDAVDALKAAVDVHPSARTHGALGDVLFTAGVADDSIYHLEAARDHDPENPDRWIALANAYYLKVDPGKAWAASRRARELDPAIRLTRDERGMFTRSGAR